MAYELRHIEVLLASKDRNGIEPMNNAKLSPRSTDVAETVEIRVVEMGFDRCPWKST